MGIHYVDRPYYDRSRGAVTFDSWLIALHLLSAAALVGAVTIFWILVIAVRRLDEPTKVQALEPLMRIGSVAVIAGSLGTIVFGVWLAITLDAYHPWDGWVIAAIVLWAIAFEVGRRSGQEYDLAFSHARKSSDDGRTGSDAELAKLCRPRLGLIFHIIASAAILLILLDMIWKPGA
ncbi:MAG: hypothetical protein ABI927_01560 [Gaiellaceae bacterium]